MAPSAEPGAAGAGPEVTASARLLRRRQVWARTAGTFVVLCLLGFAAGHEASTSGTPPPLLVSLLIQAFAVFIVVRLAIRVRARRRHRREVAAMESVPSA